MLSALAFHGLTRRNSFEVWLAVARNAHRPKIETVKTRIFRFIPRISRAGIEKHLIGNAEVKVYSAAKTAVDCFYYKNTVGLDAAMEAIRDAWRTRKEAMDELCRYAKVRSLRKDDASLS